MNERIMPSGQMAKETAETPAVIRHQFEANRRIVQSLVDRLRRQPPRLIATCARGSSDHAATFAKYLFETRLGLPTTSAAPSVSSVYGARQDLADTLFLVISQSGQSPDILAGAEHARANGALVVALVNDVASPLAEAADVALPLHAGPEISIAATKSFVASLGALLHMAAAWSGDTELGTALEALPQHLEDALVLDWCAAGEILADVDTMMIAGRGLGFGIAQEAALKLKEVAGLHAEAFSAAEIRHGPMALIGAGYPVLVFCQEDETRDSVIALARDLEAKGAQVLLARAGATTPNGLAVPHSMHPATAPLAMILSFYRLAEGLARRRGHDPDAPRHLRKVTKTT